LRRSRLRFNGIEIGTVGWQEFESCTAHFDKSFRFLVLVSGEVVRDNDVSAPKGWAEYMPNVLAKDLCDSCAVDGHAAGRPVKADRANHGRGVPMSVRRTVAHALAAAATCAKTGHIRFRSRFIDEYRAAAHRGACNRLSMPPDAGERQAGFVRWPKAVFFKLYPSPTTARCTAMTEQRLPVSSRNSWSVASGCLATVRSKRSKSLPVYTA